MGESKRVLAQAKSLSLLRRMVNKGFKVTVKFVKSALAQAKIVATLCRNMSNQLDYRQHLSQLKINKRASQAGPPANKRQGPLFTSPTNTNVRLRNDELGKL